jgi:hypothetical protein
VEQRAGGGTGHWTSATFARHGRRRCGLDFWPCETLPEMDEGHDRCEFTHGPAGWSQASVARRAAARGPARPVARPSGVPGRGARCGERGRGSTAAPGPPRRRRSVRTPEDSAGDAWPARPGQHRALEREYRPGASFHFVQPTSKLHNSKKFQLS